VFSAVSRFTFLVVVLLLCAGLFLAAPHPAWADPGSGAKAKVSLEEAIGIAKDAFTVPAGFQQFRSGYHSGEEGAVWNLHWSDEGPFGGNLRVSVSADSGEILDMYYYPGIPPGTKYTGFPKYSREAAQAIAEKTARRLQPERFRQTRLAPESPDAFRPLPGPLVRDRPITYHFHFQRLKDGIPVVGNGITVEVNGETGDVQRFSLSWDRKLELPAGAGRIGFDRAREIFNRDGLELVYVYTGPRDRDAGECPYPVYRVRDGGFVLDALTGELIDPEDYYLITDGGAGETGMPREQQRKIPDLSPAEMAAVEETRGLLSAEAARRAAEAAYSLPPAMRLTGTRLAHNWNVPGGKIWHLDYADEGGKTRVSLAVDARTGEFLRFSVYREPDRKDYLEAPVVNVSEGEARKKAEALMRKLQPEKAGQVTFRHTRRELGPWAEEGGPLPRAYTFEFARVVHGVPYPDNGFTVTVNATTGEVTHYHLKWWDTVFPEPEGIIARDRANELYLAECPLTLEYTQLYSRWVRERGIPPYSLVYRLEGRPDIMVDARSGRLLDRQGNPLVERTKGFADIAGHPAEREILLLAEAGIVAGDGGRFRPNDPVTGAELLSMLVNAYGGNRYPTVPVREDGSGYDVVLERAIAMGILDSRAGFDPAAPVTRLQAARLLVNAQGYGPLARLFTLFRLDAADAARVPAAERGYAAAAAGLGLLPLEDGHFRPDSTITRGQAAQILVRALSP